MACCRRQVEFASAQRLWPLRVREGERLRRLSSELASHCLQGEGDHVSGGRGPLRGRAASPLWCLHGHALAGVRVQRFDTAFGCEGCGRRPSKRRGSGEGVYDAASRKDTLRCPDCQSTAFPPTGIYHRLSHMLRVPRSFAVAQDDGWGGKVSGEQTSTSSDMLPFRRSGAQH